MKEKKNSIFIQRKVKHSQITLKKNSLKKNIMISTEKNTNQLSLKSSEIQQTPSTNGIFSVFWTSPFICYIDEHEYETIAQTVKLIEGYRVEHITVTFVSIPFTIINIHLECTMLVFSVIWLDCIVCNFDACVTLAKRKY